jgi:Ran GTPase-activating protein (RanGAP) involved in mRNA processing and transport
MSNTIDKKINIKDIIDTITYDALTNMIPVKKIIMMYSVSKYIRECLINVKLGIYVEINKKFLNNNELIYKLIGLKTWCTMSELHLNNHTFKEEQGFLIVEILKNNNFLRSVSLTGNYFGNDTGKVIIEELFNHRHYTMTYLDFSCNNLNNSLICIIADKIKNNNTLKSLKLNKNYFGDNEGDAIAKALCENTTLTYLDIRRNHIENFTGQFGKMLEKNNTIRSLDIGYNILGEAGGKSIIEAICINTTLTSLNLEFNNLDSKTGDAIANMINKNTTIEKLNLASNWLGVIVSIIADALRVNKTITELNLNSNNLLGDGVQEISDALLMNTTIITLDLSSNRIGEKGALAIAKLVRMNKTITTLILSNNFLRRNSLDKETGIKEIADALNENKTITELDLEHNKIGIDGIKSIAKVLCKNKKLKKLNLEHNKLRVEGARIIAEALCNNTTLEYLNLRNNKLELKGVSTIVDALCKNNTITF